MKPYIYIDMSDEAINSRFDTQGLSLSPGYYDTSFGNDTEIENQSTISTFGRFNESLRRIYEKRD